MTHLSAGTLKNIVTYSILLLGEEPGWLNELGSWNT